VLNLSILNIEISTQIKRRTKEEELFSLPENKTHDIPVGLDSDLIFCNTIFSVALYMKKAKICVPLSQIGDVILKQ